eukprot:scaffold97115_cov66-Phaeocystis_antarctica.AAC.2
MSEPGCNWNRRSGPASACASPSSSSHRLRKPERREAPSLHRTTVPHAARIRVSLPPERERTPLSSVVSFVVSSSVVSSPAGSMVCRVGALSAAASRQSVGGMTGSGAAAGAKALLTARPPSQDLEPLCSLLPQHPMFHAATCSIWDWSSGCCSYLLKRGNAITRSAHQVVQVTRAAT